MNFRKLFVKAVLLPLCLFIVFVSNAQNINRSALYKALGSNRISTVDEQLKSLGAFSGNDKNAFDGALLMRKAGIVSIPAKKLSFFKQGHKKLEGAIAADKNNAEYRFLRLMIEENAPKSLGYNKDIAEDAKIIKANYKALPVVVQQSILAYTKKSKALPASAL